MKELADILTHVVGLELRGKALERVEVRGLAFDSRKVVRGTLFIALRGAENDGHDYLEAARDRGASALLVDAGYQGPDFGLPLIEAADTRAVLGALSTYFFDEPSKKMHVIGITGTNGKTTTSYLVEQILHAGGARPGVIGTINYRWPGVELPAANTTPESLVLQELMGRMAEEKVTDLVMEVSSHGLATHRVEGTLFDVAIFTNFTQDHLDFHKTMDAYRDAKRRLFLDYLPRSLGQGKRPVAVVNIDDPEGRQLVLALGACENVQVLTYALENAKADFFCRRHQMNVDGAELEIETPHGPLQLLSPMLGAFNVSNALAAIAATTCLGVKQDAISRGFGEMSGVPGRLERIMSGVKPAVFVDYAHTPDALERALETLRPHAPGKVVVAFGCGGQRDRAKRPQMGAIASRLADRVVLTSDNPRREDPMAIIEDIREGLAGGEEVAIEVDRKRAILRAIGEAHDDDVVLLAGKGHEPYQEIDGERRPFDDAEVARTALVERLERREGDERSR